MIIPDNKKIQTIMLAKRDKTGKKVSETAGVQNESSHLAPEHAGLHSAAEDLVAAVHSKSPEHVANALQSFIEMHHAAHKED
jgi:hypothetical protein